MNNYGILDFCISRLQPGKLLLSFREQLVLPEMSGELIQNTAISGYRFHTDFVPGALPTSVQQDYAFMIAVFGKLRDNWAALSLIRVEDMPPFSLLIEHSPAASATMGRIATFVFEHGQAHYNTINQTDEAGNVVERMPLR